MRATATRSRAKPEPSPAAAHLPDALTVQGKRVAFSNLHKTLYPSGFTKREALQYYLQIAPAILPHLRNRGVTLKRYPNGSRAPFFFEKNCPDHRPDWIKTARVERAHREAEGINYCVLNDRASLLWVANLAALELHVPLGKTDNPSKPTSMVFDLDPGAPATLADCIRL